MFSAVKQPQNALILELRVERLTERRCSAVRQAHDAFVSSCTWRKRERENVFSIVQQAQDGFPASSR